MIFYINKSISNTALSKIVYEVKIVFFVRLNLLKGFMYEVRINLS